MNELQHIAFIIDGNRRWAKERSQLAFFGHKAGADNVEYITELCIKRNIPFLTFWVLSTENVKERSNTELQFLYRLIEEAPKKITKLHKEGVCFRITGDISALPQRSQKSLLETVESTKDNTKATLIFAINYGGHDEIRRTFSSLLKAGISNEELTDSLIEQHLDTAGIPHPDLIVRTGGNKRLSGFYPWQSGYSELYFSDTLWPDFGEKDLSAAIEYYNSTQRNFGK